MTCCSLELNGKMLVFVYYQAKMERQRFRDSKALLCPQTILRVNTDDGRWCSAPGGSFEASSLGESRGRLGHL